MKSSISSHVMISYISSHVRISYRFYQFVTTRYTTYSYIINKIKNIYILNFNDVDKAVERTTKPGSSLMSGFERNG